MTEPHSLDNTRAIERPVRRTSQQAIALGLLLGFAPVLDLPIGGANAIASQQSAAARNKEIVTTAFDKWAAGGNTFFADVLTPDVVWTIEGWGPSAGRFTGRDVFVERAVRPFVSRLSTPVRPVSKTIWADGNHVIINWKGEGVAADGAPYRNAYAWIFRMDAGKAVEVTAFLDLVPYDDVIRRIPAPSIGDRRP
jgi:ketosteroid isomerase-like protein